MQAGIVQTTEIQGSQPPYSQQPPWRAWLRKHWIPLSIGVLALLAVTVKLGLDRAFVTIDKRIEAGPFANTSNLYASPFAVMPSDAIGMAELTAHLDQSGSVRGASRGPRSYAVETNAVVVHTAQQQPVRIQFEEDHVASITSGDGAALSVYTLPAEFLTNIVDGSREKRRLVRFNQIPKNLVNAVTSIEDKRFFQHAGFDPVRLVKAAYVDVREGRKEQGGSTLTMQLARNLWLESDKNWRRKLIEMAISLRLEQKLSKEQIFEHYCNQVYLGRRDTFSVHGFGEGARTYFNKGIAELNLAESAMLAGLIQRPSYFNPFKYPERALERRAIVLQLMRQNQHISDAQYQAALRAPLALAQEVKLNEEAPYFTSLANDELEARFRDRSEGQAYRIYTTLDRRLQAAAEEAVRIGMAKVDRLVKSRSAGVPPQVALVAMDPHTGEVKAVVGGRDYRQSQLNRALAKRQPGSIFKPLVYAAALNTGTVKSKRLFTPSTTVVDEPTTFRFTGQTYQPNNYHNAFYGTVTLRRALAKSMNIPAVKIAQAVGYDKVVALARRAGMNEQIMPTPAVALGAYEATPLEMAGAYTMFANQGMYVRPTFIKRLQRPDGKTMYEHQPEQRRALDPRVAYLTLDMMQEVVRSGTANGVRGAGIRAPVAAKTGTSRDGWFAGFTQGLLCVVWVGFDDNRELDLEGAKSAMPIWIEFMKRALAMPRFSGEFAKAEGISRIAVDANTGLAATEDCLDTRTEMFIKGTEPRKCDSDHLFFEDDLDADDEAPIAVQRVSTP